MRLTAIAVLSLTLLIAPTAAGRAQGTGDAARPTQPPPAPAAPGTAATTAADAAVQQAIREAREATERGDLAGAVAKLDSLAAAGALSPPGLAMLGALRLETGDAAGALAVLAPLAANRPDPAVLYHAGRAALALGRAEEAAGYFQRSVELEPGTPASRELGLLRGRQGDYVAALALLRGWASTRPNDFEARVAAAFSAVRLRRAPDAEALLSGLPEDHPRVRLVRGELLLVRGQLKEAIEMLRPLLAVEAAVQGDARRLLAEAELTLGNSAAAIELLQGRVAGNPEAALLLSRAQRQQGELAAALATLQPFVGGGDEAAAIPGLLREHGRLLVSLQRSAEAVPVLERATRQDPEDEQALYALAQALTGSGRSEEAKAAMERFKALSETQESATARERRVADELADPTGAHAREALQMLADGRTEEALDLAQREAWLSPRDPRPLLAQARILLVLGRNDEALRIAEAACAIAPESADALYQRGTVRMALDQRPAAEQDLRAALALAPDHTAAMSDLAVLLMVQGKREEARRLLERVLELHPDDALAAANLERARREDGE